MKQSILRDTCMLTGGDGKNYLLLFPDPPGSMQVSLKKECFSFNGDPYFRFPFSGFRCLDIFVVLEVESRFVT